MSLRKNQLSKGVKMASNLLAIQAFETIAKKNPHEVRQRP